jgi:hypothetical protein
VIRESGRLFDAYLAVDWSARSRPSPPAPTRDALWVGEATIDAEELSLRIVASYWRTRHACIAHVRARLLAHLAAGRRVLVGFDFPYGYPAGYATALDLPATAPPWRRIWDALAGLIVDEATNTNNRFAVAVLLNARCGPPGPGPLWGCPPAACAPTLAPTSPGYPYEVGPGQILARIRRAEAWAPGTQPAWKLLGQGSVGGQALLGIPYVRALRDDPALAPASRVWPFETGFTPTPTAPPGPAIVHAEIWPGIVPGPLDPAIPIRDEAQVRAVVAWLAGQDAAGTLGALFAPPRGLTPADYEICREEEGWLLGA